jgi:hypothetical protein
MVSADRFWWLFQWSSGVRATASAILLSDHSVRLLFAIDVLEVQNRKYSEGAIS